MSSLVSVGEAFGPGYTGTAINVYSATINLAACGATSLTTVNGTVYVYPGNNVSPLSHFGALPMPACGGI